VVVRINACGICATDYKAIRLMESGLIDTETIISHRFPLFRIQEAIDVMGTDEHNKVVINQSMKAIVNTGPHGLEMLEHLTPEVGLNRAEIPRKWNGGDVYGLRSENRSVRGVSE